MRLSIIIPCYNELNTIDAIIDAVNAAPYPDKEIIIIELFKEPECDRFMNIFVLHVYCCFLLRQKTAQ